MTSQTARFEIAAGDQPDRQELARIAAAVTPRIEAEMQFMLWRYPRVRPANR